MAKKAKNSRAKQQRALKKRTVKRQKQKRARQAAADAVAAANPRRILRGARRLAPFGAWVESGWQEGVMAHVAVARSMPAGGLVFADYLVDIRCLGLLGSRYYTNVPPEDFETDILPRLYSGEPPLEISHELANEIVWGAVEYAESLGFPPHRIFRDTQFALYPADALPRAAGVQFGYNGTPLYIPAPWDSEVSAQVAVIKTLMDSVGLGNFIYRTPDGDIPEEVAELLGEAMGEAETEDMVVDDDPLWTPGGVDAASGLWIPGMQEDDAQGGAASQSAEDAGGEQPPAGGALWTPGRE